MNKAMEKSAAEYFAALSPDDRAAAFERVNATIKLSADVETVDEPPPVHTLEEYFALDLQEPPSLISDCQVVRKEITATIARAGRGKALALDTPLPTPQGWTTMGEVEVGDTVFDERGVPCEVTLATPVQHGRVCYAVDFSDGSTITADAEHLWQVHDCKRLRDVVVTTEQMAGEWDISRRGGQRRRRFSIPVAAPLELPERELPIDPYVLGAWLGDGSTADGRITFGEAFVREEIARRGYEVSHDHARNIDRAEMRTVYGLKPQLRTAGVLGDKHIPNAYLRASRAQRLALLQGLMDTDGTIGDDGRCEFSNKNRTLALGVRELCATLGVKTAFAEKQAIYKGKDCGIAYRIVFHGTLQAFLMPRKVARLPEPPPTKQLCASRRIVDVRQVDSVPVKCIQVDSPSHLYLAGEQFIATHNTTLLTNRMMRWAAGLPLFDDLPDVQAPDAPLRLLLVENEGSGYYMRENMEKLYDHIAIDEERKELAKKNLMVWGDGGYTGLKVDRDEDIATIARALEEHAPDILLLEPFRGIWSGDENDNSAMEEVLDRLIGLANTHDCGIMLSHHSNKGPIEGDWMGASRGATALEGKVAAMEVFYPVHNEEQRELKWAKKRYGKKVAPAPIRMQYDFGTRSLKRVPDSEIEMEVLSFLSSDDPPMWWSKKQIAEEVEETQDHVNNKALKPLLDQKRIVKTSRDGENKYRLKVGDNDKGEGLNF